MSNITIDPKEIRADYRVSADGRGWLYIAVPNGWDDVKKISKKVLTYGGRKFLFSGWNSDRNDCFFKEELAGSSTVVARFV
jgi:hypothetical protein